MEIENVIFCFLFYVRIRVIIVGYKYNMVWIFVVKIWFKEEFNREVIFLGR